MHRLQYLSPGESAEYGHSPPPPPLHLFGLLRIEMNHEMLPVLCSPDQAEVCAGVLVDVIRCVVSGSDGCVLGLGSADVGE